jgi:hypothetical protein
MTQTATNDPWAMAAAGNTGRAQAPAQTIPDHAANMAAIDPSADPFGTADDLDLGTGGGRGPRWVDILDRLVVIQPLKKLVDQPVVGDSSGRTQSFYAVNLTVLDGGPLEIVSPAREVNGRHYDEQRNTYTPPHTFENWYAYGAGATNSIDKLLAKKIGLFLGVVKRCPTGNGYKAGETWEDTTKRYQEWENKVRTEGPGRAGNSPQFTWDLATPAPEQKAYALEWYCSTIAAS